MCILSRLALLGLLLSWAATGQIKVLFTPATDAQKQQLFGPLKECGMWYVSVYNAGTTPATIDAQRIYWEAMDLSLIGKAAAVALLSRKRQERAEYYIVRGVHYLSVAFTGAAASGLIRAGTGAVAWSVIGMGVLNEAAGRLETKIPVIDSGLILDGQISLDAGRGAQYVAFSRPFDPEVIPRGFSLQ